MIQFYNITDRQNQEYLEAIEVYKASTSENQQISPETIDEKMDSGNLVIILGKQNVMPVFVAMLWKLEGTSFMVNEVVAIIPSFQHLDFGKMYFDVLKHSDYYQNNHILFEAEDPDFGNKEERKAKLDYYFLHGCQWVKGVKTVVPMPNSEEFVNTVLLLLTKDRFINISQEELSIMLKKLYKELYNTPEDAYLIKELLKEIPKIIELSGTWG
ncbi:MAG: hypothetical protein B7C24_08540 [Bacteroidetes bacterium 4572_77]|nr:MAG: hypothetical protein B7C24_08540 [Bacteroidetes bacterium 4572_77]